MLEGYWQWDSDFKDTDLVTFLPQHREGALRLHPRLSFYQMGAPEENNGKGLDACLGGGEISSIRH